MKHSLWLIALVVVGVVLYFLLRPARKYNWEPTFSHQSEEPFGCKLFDEMAAATMPKGYTYSDDDPEELLKSEGGMALLIINNNNHYTSEWDYAKIQQLEEFVSRGNKLLIVSNHFYVNYSDEDVEDDDEVAYENNLTDDLLYLDTQYDKNFFLDDFRVEVNNKLKDDVIWTLSPTDTMRIYKSIVGNAFTQYIESSDISVELHEKQYVDFPDHAKSHYATTVTPYDVYADEHTNISVIALRHKIGNGTFYVHCNPLLFTNYGVLNHDISLYLNHAMTELSDCQVVRMPADKFMESIYDEGGQPASSPLSFMLSRPPLRWALYTILAALLLFMFFTARRRQRVIPVVKQPENRNLQFVRLISSIYFHQGDRHDLLRKKYTYFKDELRRILQMDIDDHSLLNSNIQTLSQLTNIEEQVIKANLVNIPFFTEDSNYLDKAEMMRYIDFMNDLLKKL